MLPTVQPETEYHVIVGKTKIVLSPEDAEQLYIQLSDLLGYTVRHPLTWVEMRDLARHLASDRAYLIPALVRLPGFPKVQFGERKTVYPLEVVDQWLLAHMHEVPLIPGSPMYGKDEAHG